MKSVLLAWLLVLPVWARPTTFRDGQCQIVFPGPFGSHGNRVSAQWSGNRYTLVKSPLRTLDPAQQLASLRRSYQSKGARVLLIRLGGLDGLEIRRAHWLARVFVYRGTTYQAEVAFAGKEPGAAQNYLRSLRFLERVATPYTPQRMQRYDVQVRDVPVQKCAENLLEISSLLTGFKIQHKRYPTALSGLGKPITRAYGYRLKGGHYLLYCSGHRHPGVPAHYPRSDDKLHTMLSPTRSYRPGY